MWGRMVKRCEKLRDEKGKRTALSRRQTAIGNCEAACSSNKRLASYYCGLPSTTCSSLFLFPMLGTQEKIVKEKVEFLSGAFAEWVKPSPTGSEQEP